MRNKTGKKECVRFDSEAVLLDIVDSSHVFVLKIMSPGGIMISRREAFSLKFK